MADKYKIPQHRVFKGAVDADYLDAEDSNIQYLQECTNLTPFRKKGSLQQVAGTGIDLPNASLPNPGGTFVPIDLYYFSLDKDSKTITVLIFQDSNGIVKYYITPYWNPSAEYSNYNPNKTASSWISEWLELTESFSSTIQLVSSFSVQLITNSPSTTNDYYNGWFIVNTSQTKTNRFNYITDYVGATGTATLISSVDQGTVWALNDPVILYRFPVCHLYNTNPNFINESRINTDFKAVPTQFIYKENALRIPCGKENRPLIIEFIKERKYFMGQNEMSYDGFWFGFQQIPQVMKNSAVSAFGYAWGTTANDSYLYVDWTWNAATSGTHEVLFTINTIDYASIRIRSFTGTAPPG